MSTAIMVVQNQDETSDALSLPIGKLRGVSFEARLRLKRQRITRAQQLLHAAGPHDSRLALAQRTMIEPRVLQRMVCRADLSRLQGVGAVFGDMLEELHCATVQAVARQDPEDLHQRLQQLNNVERMARRAPTLDEVQRWVRQARDLKPLVEL